MRRRQPPAYSADEVEHAESVWDYIHTLPVVLPTRVAPTPRRRLLSAAAAQLIVSWTLGANSSAITVEQLEDEVRHRCRLTGDDDLIHNVHGLRRAVFTSFLVAGAAWGSHRVGAAPTLEVPVLPPFIDAQQWQRSVRRHLDRHAAEHGRLVAALDGGRSPSAARDEVQIRGGRTLLRVALELSLHVAAAPTLADDARRRYEHYCRCCGDAACRSHCQRSVLGEHRAAPGAPVCGRCGVEVDAEAMTPRWTALGGTPETWAAPRRLTEDEAHFEDAFETMIRMMDDGGAP